MENSFKHYSDMDISALVEGMSAGVLDYTFDDLKEVQTELVNRRMSSRYMGIVSGLMRDMIEQGRVEESSDDSADNADSGADLVLEDIAPAPAAPIPLAPAAKIAPKPIAPISTLEENLAAVHGPVKIEPPKPMPILTPPPAPKAAQFTHPPAAARPKATPPMGEGKQEHSYGTLEFLVGFYKVLAWFLVAATLGAYAYAALTLYNNDMMMVIFMGGAAMTISALLLLICFALSESVRWKLDISDKLERLK